ncbi:hypothetical protein M8J75_014548 [Diaphorina citri]|nr:hypothetical protein M8J75_014548 [Diaphorina citri]
MADNPTSTFTVLNLSLSFVQTTDSQFRSCAQTFCDEVMWLILNARRASPLENNSAEKAWKLDVSFPNNIRLFLMRLRGMGRAGGLSEIEM